MSPPLPISQFRLRLLASGPAVAERTVAAAAVTLAEVDPFLEAIGVGSDRLEVVYCEQAPTLSTAVEQADALWLAWREEIGLPGWTLARVVELAADETLPGSLVPQQRRPDGAVGGPRTYRLL